MGGGETLNPERQTLNPKRRGGIGPLERGNGPMGFRAPHELTEGTHALSCQQLVRLTRLVLENILIQVGDTVVRQIIGFPMGMHSSSCFCDTYFIRYEYEHVWRALRHNRVDIAAASIYNFRYQDI